MLITFSLTSAAAAASHAEPYQRDDAYEVRARRGATRGFSGYALPCAAPCSKRRELRL